MFKHFYKHLDLFDKVFIVFLIVLGVLSGFAGLWASVAYLFVLLMFVLILKSKDIVIEHQSDIIDRLFEVSEDMLSTLGGRKIVKTTTIEFNVERKKPRNEKPSNQDTPNAGRSGSRSSKKPAGSSKTAKSKGTGTTSVPNRKPSATKKNRKA